jgi:hypothetical protein
MPGERVQPYYRDALDLTRCLGEVRKLSNGL